MPRPRLRCQHVGSAWGRGFLYRIEEKISAKPKVQLFTRNESVRDLQKLFRKCFCKCGLSTDHGTPRERPYISNELPLLLCLFPQIDAYPLIMHERVVALWVFCEAITS